MSTSRNSETRRQAGFVRDERARTISAMLDSAILKIVEIKVSGLDLSPAEDEYLDAPELLAKQVIALLDTYREIEM